MSRSQRMISLLSIDALIVAISVYGAFLLRFDFHIPTQFYKIIPYVMLWEVILVLFSFYYFKIYKRIWKYASIGDLLSIIKGTLVSIGLFFILHHYGVHSFFSSIIVPRSIYPLSAMLIMLCIGGSRLAWRMIRDTYIRIQPYHRKAMVVGAGSAGMLVVKELKHSNSEYYPVAFIDDDSTKRNLEVLGIPVVGTRNEIINASKEYEINYIIIALPSASKTEIAEILDICKKTGCQIKIIPRMNDLINGKVTVNMIRDVSVEDLLGRDAVNINLNEVSDYLKEKVVLVTGAGGSIGSELCRQISRFSPKKLILLGHGENSIYDIELELQKNYPDVSIHPIIADVQHKERIKQVMEKFAPEVVFHAAAHKHVPLMESNPMEAIKNNVFGTKNVAELSHECGVKRFVMISTDKAVNPTSVMGASKRIAEMIVQSLNQISDTQFVSVRFGNVLGSRGSVIPVFKKQIEEGGPVTVTHPDMVRYFMTIPEAVQLVIQTGALAQGGEVFILDMGQPVKIADLAYDLIRLSGMEPNKDIEIKYSGIRPGEKLFEEILTDEEGTSATKHNRIYVSKPSHISFDKLNEIMQEFEVLLQRKNVQPIDIKKQLNNILPSYLLENSQYSSYVVKETLKSSLEMVAAIEQKIK